MCLTNAVKLRNGSAVRVDAGRILGKVWAASSAARVQSCPTEVLVASSFKDSDSN